jgi:hypothetical protein
LSLEQLREIKDVNATLLLEPIGRNTAPALTLAAIQATEGGQDPILVVTPADQTVQKPAAFQQALQQSIRAAAECLGGFPNLQALRVGGGAGVREIVLVLLTRSVVQLDLSGNVNLKNSAPLAALVGLQQLKLRNTQVGDVSGLWALPNLQALDLGACPVQDAGVLSTLTNLRSLDISRTRVANVDSLAKLTNLSSLDMSRAPVRSVDSLSTLTTLTTLSIYGAPVQDIGSLSALVNLREVNVGETRVSSLASLSTLTKLRTLNVYGLHISDPDVRRLGSPVRIVRNYAP